ncbi:hypothetical protein Taro_030941 [Colocasia esculenta]|uniref:Uncharacterized protein n=1 Tax=Colocasia esculenta TaxID=4460 RepID=A0A843W1N8_COLES|nr:hypothetical protein [Colocasia esculenta]
MRVAVADRAEIDGSDGGSCEKLLGVRRESSWRLVQLLEAEEVNLFRGELDGEICTVRFFRATLRLDDWRVWGPQPVSRDVECDSVLCVLLVVVSSRSPWSPFSTCCRACEVPVFLSALLRELRTTPPIPVCCTGSFEAVEPCLSGASLAWLLSVSCSALWRSGTLKMFREGEELLSYRCRLDCVALRLFYSVSVAPVGLYMSPWLRWIVFFPVPYVFLPDGGLLVVESPVVHLGTDLSRLTSAGFDVGFVLAARVLPSEAGGWFSCWRLKKSTSRDVDVDLFKEERVGGPQPVSRDVECDSVLCVLLVVVSGRSPWSPFSTV